MYKQTTAYENSYGLVDTEMCMKDRPMTSRGINFLDETSKYFAIFEAIKTEDITPIKLSPIPI